MSEDETNQIQEGSIIEHGGKGKLVVEKIDSAEIVVGNLGDRLRGDCPVEYGDECIDPDCDGRIGEAERDPDTYSAHELYCFGCGLNWVEQGNLWKEQYADWPTSFKFEEADSEQSSTETEQGGDA